MHQIFPQKGCLSQPLFWQRLFFLKHRRLSSKGLTLIEMMTVIGIIATLAAIAAPTFMRYLDKARVIKAIGDIRTIEKDIFNFQMDHNRFPDTLGQVNRGSLLDPWGNPYRYTNIARCNEQEEEQSGKGGKGGKAGGGGSGECGKGNFRKDRFLVPINSDFDLYSIGKDGQSAAPLTSKLSRDDIVRANNGGFVGLAWKY